MSIVLCTGTCTLQKAKYFFISQNCQLASTNKWQFLGIYYFWNLVFKCIVLLSINTVKKSTLIYTYGTSSQHIYFYQFYFCLKSLEQTRKFIHQNPIPVLRDWWASYLCLEFCPVTKAQWAMGCPQQCPVLAKQTNLLMCLWILRDAGSDKASILKLYNDK